LPAATTDEASTTEFARRHGVGLIVLERTATPQTWDRLYRSGDVRTIPLLSSQPRFRGDLRIVRIDGMADPPEPLSRQPSNVLG
jgi:hypothetical protein